MINLPLAGTYQLSVTNAGYTGSYSFNLLNLAQPAAVLATTGAVTTATLNPSNSTAIYTFSATAGTNVWLAASVTLANSQSVDFRLIGPAGNQFQGSTALANAILKPFAATGIYTLLIEGDHANTGAINYSLALSDIANPAPDRDHDRAERQRPDRRW